MSLQSRPMVVTDFEDINLFDAKDAKNWQRTPENATKRLSGSAAPQDLHASVQSMSSSTSTNSSDSSSLRSSLSSFSSPALLNSQFVSPGFEEKPGVAVNPKPNTPIQNMPQQNWGPSSKARMHSTSDLSTFNRRPTVPMLLDNTSMASLTMKAGNMSRRKQRELEFEADQDDDIWPGDSLMFNVPMSPALYAQQKKRHGSQGSSSGPGGPGGLNGPGGLSGPGGEKRLPNGLRNPSALRNMPMRRRGSNGPLSSDMARRSAPPNATKTPSPLQHEVASHHRSRSSGHQQQRSPLPAINEHRDFAPTFGDDSDFDFTFYDNHDPSQQAEHAQNPYYRGSDTSALAMSSSSLPSLLSRRGSCANSTRSSIDGLNQEASDLTLEFCRLEEQAASRRNSPTRQSKRTTVDSTTMSISSLAMSDIDTPLPSPQIRNSQDSISSVGSSSSGPDSRRSSLTRPENLPAKDPEYERKHLQEYEQLLKDAAAAEKKKQQKLEEHAKRRAHQTKQDLATWHYWLSKGGHSRLSSDLKWRGIPEQARGAIWFQMKGGDCAKLEAKPPVTENLEQIVADSENIWPECAIFGSGRPLHESLVFVVQHFLAERPEIKYCKSILGLAALLLLYLDARQALVVLVNLIVPGSLPFSILSGNERITSANYVSFQKLFAAKFETLAAHFERKGVRESELLNPMLSSIFTTVMPTPENAARLLDVFMFDGDTFLLRAALGLLRINEAWLYGSKEEIFQEIERVHVDSEDEMMKVIREVTRK